MKNIIVIHPKKEMALAIRSIIEKGGFHVSHICALGASALKISSSKQSGIIVCPFVMKDMSATELALRLPQNFDVIALSTNGSEQYMGNLITLPLPINYNEFISTISVLNSSVSSFTKRSEDEKDYISKAKEVLFTVKGMSEVEAHKYLQNQSMKNGKSIAKVAMDILDEFA